MAQAYQTKTFNLIPFGTDDFRQTFRSFKIISVVGDISISIDDQSSFTQAVAQTGFQRPDLEYSTQISVRNNGGSPATLTIGYSDYIYVDDRSTISGGIQLVGADTFTRGAINITSDALTEIRPANPLRKRLVLWNDSDTDTLLIAETTGVTSSQGFPIPPKSSFVIECKAAVYARTIPASGVTINVRWYAENLI